MSVYITASGLQTIAAAADGFIVQINKALVAETIVVAVGGVTQGIITGAAAAGAKFEFYGNRGKGAVTLNPSATVDVTVNFTNRNS